MPLLPGATCESLTEYYNNELCNLQKLVYQYEVALSALLTGTHQSYEIDTGQSRQRVTRLDIDDLQKTLQNMRTRLAELELFLGKRVQARQINPCF
jgi:hypothetical protein